MRAALVSMVILAVAGAASAAISVTAGTYSYDKDAGTVSFDVLISSDAANRITGANLNVQIGDGMVQGIDITNVVLSIFGATGAPVYTDLTEAGFPSMSLVSDLCTLTTSDPTVPAQGGILATVTMSVVGAAEGVYDLQLLGTYNGDSNLLFTPGRETDVAISNGTITITPEPATLSVLALGGLALLRRRR